MINLSNNFSLVSIEGLDNTTFLQGQLTIDLNNMQNNEIRFSAHCNALGKVESFFILGKKDDKYFSIIENSLTEHFIKCLKKYAIFSKINFSNILEKSIKIDLDFSKLDIIFDNTEINFKFLTKLNSNNKSVKNLLSYQDLFINYGIALFDISHINKFIPQNLNLDSLGNCISFEKGCYIGQETIARAKYRGANKYCMKIFKVNNQNINQNIKAKPISFLIGESTRNTGEILNYIQKDNILYLQAIINNKYENKDFSILIQEKSLPLEKL